MTEYKLVPVEPTPETIQRLQAAFEGECNGLSIPYEQAKAILEYVFESAPSVPAELKPLRPKMYWENSERGYDYADDLEALLDNFGHYDDIKVGSTYSLNEAYYFGAKFEVTKVPDEPGGDYGVKRIDGTQVVRLSDAAAIIAAKDAEMETRSEDIKDITSKALRKAWQLGQTYWQQVDSEYISRQKKSDATRAKFMELIDDTRKAIDSAMKGEK